METKEKGNNPRKTEAIFYMILLISIIGGCTAGIVIEKIIEENKPHAKLVRKVHALESSKDILTFARKAKYKYSLLDIDSLGSFGIIAYSVDYKNQREQFRLVCYKYESVFLEKKEGYYWKGIITTKSEKRAFRKFCDDQARKILNDPEIWK